MVIYLALKELYETGKTVGSGGFGKVKFATHLLTEEKVAIKIMEKELLGADLPRVKMEIEALKSFSHHHISRLYEVIETDTHYFLVLEYCAGGELFDHIINCTRLSEMTTRIFLRQILSAVAYLHSKGYVHRDLKPENVLLDKDQGVKLIDFGLCAKPSPSITSHLDTACGSPTYAAPELIRGDKYIGPKVDVWSLGVMLYALLCGCLPFHSDNIEILYKQIESGKYMSPSHLSEGSKKLLKSMLQIDPSKRITVEELLNHPWVKLGFNEPVSMTSLYQDIELDKSCVSVMAAHYHMTSDEVWQKLSVPQYDSFAATYQLLLSRKKQNLPIKLVQMHNVRKRRGRPKSVMNNSRNNHKGTYLALPTSKPPNVQETKENQEVVMQPPVFTPVKVPRKRARSLNRESSLSPASKKPASLLKQSKTNFNKDKNANHNVLTTPENKSSPSRRLFNSIERKIRKALTPGTRRSRGIFSNMFPEVDPKKMSNISTTSSSDAVYVRNQLITALRKRGFECKSTDFSIRGKLKSPDGKQCVLSFELEVCYIPATAPAEGLTVIIRRKRLKGDAWHYKSVCEEILNLADIN